MGILQAFLLGLIQGLTEFLPVSSSGHLALFSRITGQTDSLMFDLVVHCATLAAVVIVYFSDVKAVLRRPLAKPMRLILLATLVTTGVAFVLKDFAEGLFTGEGLKWCFLATGIVLILGARLPRRYKSPAGEIGYLDAVLIGGVQGVAVLPGLSRSGLTVSAANLLNCKRESNASFCFILSIPAILGSTFLELISGSFAPIGALPLLVGFLTAFLSGFIALTLLKRFLKRGSFGYFAIYLFALSAFLILNDFIFNLF